ncbi:MAG: bifunctional adenosylcobinamide kinase/adenosylcobinamide-phosphate guanylyltransferase [Sulfitobacter sp.]
MLPRSTFVLGGAASGKSLWAENLLLSSGLTPFYVATSQIFDAETQSRVAVHRARRDTRWHNVEAPLELGSALVGAPPHSAALIDCATMWLTNHLMAENDLAASQERLLIDLRSSPVPWIIVTNEVGHGIVPDNALARQFREAQGRLNIALAALADVAVQVTAGLPQILKGHLP